MDGRLELLIEHFVKVSNGDHGSGLTASLPRPGIVLGPGTATGVQRTPAPALYLAPTGRTHTHEVTGTTGKPIQCTKQNTLPLEIPTCNYILHIYHFNFLQF